MKGTYHYSPADDGDKAEYVVPVEWISTMPKEQALHKKGLFANQNSACKLPNKFTLNTLYAEFGIDDGDQDG